MLEDDDILMAHRPVETLELEEELLEPGESVFDLPARPSNKARLITEVEKESRGERWAFPDDEIASEVWRLVHDFATAEPNKADALWDNDWKVIREVASAAIHYDKLRTLPRVFLIKMIQKHAAPF